MVLCAVSVDGRLSGDAGRNLPWSLIGRETHCCQADGRFARGPADCGPPLRAGHCRRTPANRPPSPAAERLAPAGRRGPSWPSAPDRPRSRRHWKRLLPTIAAPRDVMQQPSNHPPRKPRHAERTRRLSCIVNARTVSPDSHASHPMVDAEWRYSRFPPNGSLDESHLPPFASTVYRA